MFDMHYISIFGCLNSYLQFFIIYVPSQQPEDTLNIAINVGPTQIVMLNAAFWDVDLHGDTSQKTAFFIGTAVKTSNPTNSNVSSAMK
jgi:hypothetical protein